MTPAEELVDWTSEAGLREIERRIAARERGEPDSVIAYERMVRYALPQLVRVARVARG
jgi:hypothetical protein